MLGGQLLRFRSTNGRVGIFRRIRRILVDVPSALGFWVIDGRWLYNTHWIAEGIDGLQLQDNAAVAAVAAV